MLNWPIKILAWFLFIVCFGFIVYILFATIYNIYSIFYETIKNYGNIIF